MATDPETINEVGDDALEVMTLSATHSDETWKER